MTSGTIDYEKLFLSDWFNYPHGGSNNLGSDFNLFSSMEDAKHHQTAWPFCNYNDPGIGFPRDCGPNGHVAYTWNSLNKGGQADYAYFLYTGTAHEYSGWTQVFGRGTMACLDTKADVWNSIKQGSYVRRVCPGCQLNHKDIIYKRLTPVDNIDFEDLFLSNWFIIQMVVVTSSVLISSCFRIWMMLKVIIMLGRFAITMMVALDSPVIVDQTGIFHLHGTR
jgi:hypothetical protein